MNAPFRNVGLGVTVLVTGGALGFGLGRETGSAPGRGASSSRPSALVSAPSASLSQVDKLALRALMREELGALTRERTEGTAPPVPTPTGEIAAAKAPDEEALAPTPEQIAAFDAGKSFAQAALARGSVVEADRVRLHETVSTLPESLRMDVLRPLIVALNEGRLETDGPIF